MQKKIIVKVCKNSTGSQFPQCEEQSTEVLGEQGVALKQPLPALSFLSGAGVLQAGGIQS